MKVEFWFDPVCPFCWMTSRWILSIAPQRDLEIEWRSISLRIKNDPPPESPFYAKTGFTLGLLRVIESVEAAGHADRTGDLYREFGRRIHHEGLIDFAVEPILESLGLDPGHAAAQTDESFDIAVLTDMEDGLGLTGTDVGVPLIALESNGSRVGFFGPVISDFPTGLAALRLWDGFVAMTSVPDFFELKRSRTGAPGLPPDSAV